MQLKCDAWGKGTRVNELVLTGPGVNIDSLTAQSRTIADRTHDGEVTGTRQHQSLFSKNILSHRI